MAAVKNWRYYWRKLTCKPGDIFTVIDKNRDRESGDWVWLGCTRWGYDVLYRDGRIAHMKGKYMEAWKFSTVRDALKDGVVGNAYTWTREWDASWHEALEIAERWPI